MELTGEDYEVQVMGRAGSKMFVLSTVCHRVHFTPPPEMAREQIPQFLLGKKKKKIKGKKLFWTNRNGKLGSTLKNELLPLLSLKHLFCIEVKCRVSPQIAYFITH